MKTKYLGKLDETSIPQIVIKETVKEILLIAEKELRKPRKELTVLDIGSGFGRYSMELAKYVKRVIGVEPFKPAFERSVVLNRNPKVFFFNSLIEDFETNERFDLAISLTTLEHMPKAEKSFRHVFKYMKEKSLLYITAPNKLWPIEPHYSLLFLSWFPLAIANLYMQIMNKGQSYENCSYSKTYFGMKKLFNRFPYKYFFVVPDPNAVYLGCGSHTVKSAVLRRSGVWLIKKFPIFWIFSKGFILVVKKG